MISPSRCFRVCLSGSFLVASLCLSADYAHTRQAESRQRPSLVIILADDLGYGDPSCYAETSKIPTPHLDGLAAQGMRFTDAHSPSSVCSPTRYALLTGRYAWRTELKRSVLWEWDAPLIEETRQTLPALLQSQGYATACIGKWHLGWTWAVKEGPPLREVLRLGHHGGAERHAVAQRIDFGARVADGPLARGFDHYFGDDVPNFPPYAFLKDERLLAEPTVAKPDKMFGHAGPMVEGWQLNAVMPELERRAVRWIERHVAQDSQRPFFLYLPLTAPHTPIVPDARYRGKSRAGRYGDFVAQVDGFVGSVLAALQRTGLASDTIVVFTSDNGSPARDGSGASGAVGSVEKRHGHRPSGPWRGMKGDIWEGGHRVPLVVRWPGRIRAGSENPTLIGLQDIYATMTEILDLEIPEQQAEDSRSFLGALLERPKFEARSSLVHHSSNGTFAIRSGPWKLIPGQLGSGGFTKPSQVVPAEGGPGGQLYHLADDPGERQNRWLEEPEKVRQLMEQLEEVQSLGSR